MSSATDVPGRPTALLPRQGGPAVSRTALAAALAGGRLEAHYQPVVSLVSRHVVGFEALARLRGGDRSLIAPSRFIPTAERSGQIRDLGMRMLELSIVAATGWRSESGTLSTATLSVNVAPAQLADVDFAARVRDLLAEHALPASALILEITESTATSVPVRPSLDRLSAMGVRIALDDFGMGFANLDQLRRLPIHIIKLDQSFVAGITRRGPDEAIVRVVIDLADALGLSVIGEGVETAEQAAALERLGCSVAQGYLFARPGPNPMELAAGVAMAVAVSPRRLTESAADPREQRLPWPVSIELTVLAAARLLAGAADRYRAALYAVVLDIARRVGSTEATTHAVGRLALVHDLSRLDVDAALPQPLLDVPVFVGLVAGETGAHPELRLLAVAQDVVSRAEFIDPHLSPAALAVAAARHAASPGLAPMLSVALGDLSEEPPAVVATGLLLDDLDVRRLGRRGVEDRLRSLVGLSRVLTGARDTRQLLRVALEEVRRITGAASASLERWERDTGLLHDLVNVGDLGPGEEMFPADETYAISEFMLTVRTLIGGLPVFLTRADADIHPAEVGVLERLQKGSVASVPLHLEDRVWGQLYLTTGLADPDFGPADTELLVSVATLMSGVLAQAENLDRMSRHAFEDPLTRLANRRRIDDTLDKLQSTGASAVVAILDVDGLKCVNDRFGHLRGDEILCAIADALSAVVSPLVGAVAGRLGGDEFCVVLPGVTVEAAREALTTAAAVACDATGTGFSVGLALAQGAWTVRDVLAAADSDLYGAKRRRGGRREGGHPPKD